MSVSQKEYVLGVLADEVYVHITDPSRPDLAFGDLQGLLMLFRIQPSRQKDIIFVFHIYSKVE